MIALGCSPVLPPKHKRQAIFARGVYFVAAGFAQSLPRRGTAWRDFRAHGTNAEWTAPE